MTTWMNRLANGVVALAVVAPIAYLAAHWTQFPETVPSHFGPSGRPDGWGSRIHLVLLPMVGLVISTVMSGVRRFPHLFNYPVRITEENQARQQALALGMIDRLRVLVAVMLGYVSIQQMRTALGITDGLGTWFLYFVLGGVFSMLGVYFFRAIRAR